MLWSGCWENNLKEGISMIKFTDFIKDFTEGKDLNRIKLKFHKNAEFCGGEKDTSQYLFEDDESLDSMWTTLNSWRAKGGNSSRLDECDYLITFAQYNLYGSNFYIFGGIYQVEKTFPEKYDKGGYNIKLLENYKEYRKKLVIKTKDLGPGIEIYYKTLDDNDEKLEIYQMFPNINFKEFNGYQNVSITHKELREIVSNNELSWKLALSYIKAVYVITDTKTGKLYIGSASGNSQGLWQRWECYADFKDLTGGNKEFEVLVKEKGKDYIKDNFKYSILEIFDTKTKQEYILERENYWKNVFETKKFGMNWN